MEFIFKSLAVGKASGPDGISNLIVRELVVEISLPVCSLCNQSLYNGEVPDGFKEANVSPVYKGGNPTTVSNHRPTSLLNNLEKSLERLVFKYFYNHFLELHGPSMLPDKAKFVVCSIISPALSFWMKHLVIGQLQKLAKFSAFHWSTSRSQAFIGQLLGTSR